MVEREPLTRYCAFSTYILLFGLDSETTLVPGATTSGLAMKSMAVGPRELNGAMVSSWRRAVPLAFDAPTVSTHGALAGAVMAPYWGSPLALRPMLPAAATTTMPASTARLAARVSGSVL